MKFFKKQPAVYLARCIMMLVLGLTVATGTLAAQEQKVALSSRTITIEEAFRQIEAQTGLVVAFSAQKLNTAKQVTLPGTEGNVKEILTRLLAGSGQTFEIKDNYIFLRVAPQPYPAAPKPEAAPEPARPEEVRGVYIPAVTFREVLTPDPEPVPAPLGNYPSPYNLTATPSHALKTNILLDATLAINLAWEVRLGHKITFELPVTYTAIQYSWDMRWKYFLVQPGVRFWNCEAFNGSFWGVYAHYGRYNVGGDICFFSDYMKTHREQGWFAGAGISYGHHWTLGGRWGLEAEIGAGWAHIDNRTYEPVAKYAPMTGHSTKEYFGVTKAAFTFVFMIK